MEGMLICQSCGMPLTTDAEMGTEADGSKSSKYCTHCYQNGGFTKDCTMEEMIETNLEYLDQWNTEQNENYTVDEARVELMNYFPSLERWKK